MSTQRPEKSTSRPQRRATPGAKPMSLAGIADMSPEEIAARRLERRLIGLSDKEVLRLWYTSDEPWQLTERQEWVRQRWDLAKAMFLKRKRFSEIQTALCAEFSISVPQASIDIRNALAVFGDLDKVPKEAHRQRTIEMALKTFEVAKKAGDPAGMASATKMYYLATGQDKDDPDRVDMERLMNERTYAEIIDPAIRDLLLNFLERAGGSVDITALFETIYAAKNAEFTSFEEVPDDAGTDPDGD